MSKSITIRLAEKRDIRDIVDMMTEFRKGHPSEKQPRGKRSIEDAYFGDKPAGELIVAERSGSVMGMVQWSREYDMFWETYYGIPDWLFVRSEARGLGLWVALMAFVCDRVRQAGGTFLSGHGNEVTSHLYARFASAGKAATPFYLSAEAFQQFADLAGSAPRDIVRKLPSLDLNRVAARPRP